MSSHNQAPCEGLWRPTAKTWQRVEAGEELGTLRGKHGEVRYVLCSCVTLIFTYNIYHCAQKLHLL